MPDMPSGRKARYFRNEPGPLSQRNPHKQLIASLTRLVTSYSPDQVSAGGGLYDGPISIAFLFFILQGLYPDFDIESAPMGTWFAVYLEQAQNHISQYPGPTPQRCGISDDIMALVALSAASAKDGDMARELCDFVDVVTDDGASNEWLYGRAGYLYLLRLVRASFVDDDEVCALIDETANEVIEAILDSPRPWKWHDKAYLGAAHGAIGIIMQVVLTAPSYARELEAELAALLSYQLPGGNFPSSVPSGGDRLVQFCHGAPGLVSSLVSMRAHFPALEARIDEAVRRGREAIWERGLLTKLPCLCHGISGNALALEWDEFEHFLSHTTRAEVRAMEKDGVLERSEQPESLWCGEAGQAWAWAVADCQLERRFLGYNDV